MSAGEIMPRSQIFQCLHVLGFLRIVTFLLFMTGCHHKDELPFEGITWNGKALTLEREVLNPTQNQLNEEGFPIAFVCFPKRFLSFHPADLKDEVKLMEFSGENEAYLTFQRFANSRELEEGYLFRGNRVVFRKGKWLGSLIAGPDESKEWLKNTLRFSEMVDWEGIPAGFSSFIFQNRIPASERVIASHFFGSRLDHKVFSARFECIGDSAWVYFSPGMPPHAVYTEFNKPLKLDFSEFGMVGVEGCFDDSLTNYWIQVQKKVLKSLKLKPYSAGNANFN